MNDRVEWLNFKLYFWGPIFLELVFENSLLILKF
jgi:hypothetical protein